MNQKIKIAFLADPIDNQDAGIHVYTREMIASIEKVCTQLKLVSIRSGSNKAINNESDFFLKHLKLPGSRAYRYFIQLPNTIKKLKPDIVIEPAHFGPFNLSKRIKRVTIIHDLTPIKNPEWHNFHHGLLQKIFLPSILKKANLVITNSQNTLNDLREHYPFTISKSTYIYPGIDPFYGINKEEVKNEKENFILTTGTIEPRKNYNILLDAYQLFRETTSHKHKLVICGGKGWKAKSFYKKLENHPFKSDIHLKGFVPKAELKELYKNTTTFIFPSLYEGFGFPVAEAMACGAPCIISQSSSLTEVGGDAVLYFDPKLATELAEQIETLINSPTLSITLINKGLEHSKNFNWKTFATRFEVEMQQLENQKL